jgi:5-formyltetrahydrofolate cyclo-ligase
MELPQQIQASRKIGDRIRQLSVYQEASSILVYFSHRNEVSLYPLIEDAWKQGKQVSLPSMEQNTIVPRLFTSPAELELGSFRILEPNATCEKVKKSQIDVVLVPGVAFDQKRYRLGFGKGHYDRFFATLPAVFKCGIAYDEQIVEAIDVENHDIPMDILITPSQNV